MPIVVLKPDALSGEREVVPGRRAAAFLRALADLCVVDEVLDVGDDDMRAAVQRARAQVSERARDEPSFRGVVGSPDACAIRFLNSSDKVAGRPTTSTRDTLVAAIQGFGFAIERFAGMVCTEVDIDGLYACTVTTSDFSEIRPQLVGYLCGREVLALQLGEQQPTCVLQWWKTYARHTLLERSPGVYLLRNLVHVCEDDEGYLRKRLGW